ncbi:hypothetical protein [Ciceribacter thiooxidans]|uniref:Uncharacterized protein n=1 Tax=Ciceribacter thiooxidans TaxID=1969821 RepID=A0ABV7I1Q6_9HYPH|nr:hypothetical protein [Ciceribacter thiooxidans]MDI6835285.1 hypothetical protein [Rhizobiaceae bacterium]
MARSIGTPTPKNNENAAEAERIIDRLAEELRASGGVDLPHSYFVEQVKLRLVGSDLSALDTADTARTLIRGWKPKATPSVFNAWAMPEQV